MFWCLSIIELKV